MNSWIFVVLVALPYVSWADGGEEAHGSRAIEASDQAQGFRLRERAARALGVEFAPIDSNNLIAEPSGIVRFQDFIAVYRKRDGWIRMVEIEGTKSNGGALKFFSKDFRTGDEIAIRGAPALRVIDMDLWGPKADACGD